MSKNSLASFKVRSIDVWWLPIQTRVPLKFGTETLTSVVVARVRLTLEDSLGKAFVGWGETPLSTQWVWPSPSSYEWRTQQLKDFVGRVAAAWIGLQVKGHALELGHAFQEQVLPRLLQDFNDQQPHGSERLPHLAALLCVSPIDLALHDAYGKLLGRPIYSTYGGEFFARDLASYLTPASRDIATFEGRYPGHYVESSPRQELLAWHLVGGLDPIDASQLTGAEPSDGYPVLLADWIRRDGLKCLKIKLRGNDAVWDYQRLCDVGQVSLPLGVQWLTADFNCTVMHPEYVTVILDRLKKEHPELDSRLLYVEQPFPYELDQHRIDVRPVSVRKPLFLDESAHDWRMIRLGRELGWTGVALKTCKTQTGAILSACWAKAHGMQLMVQDLTNPMLAQIPHLMLAAHVDTIMGVETNAMQFYPEASAPEARVHPGLYLRRNGMVKLDTLHGPGYGMRVTEIQRELPRPACQL